MTGWAKKRFWATARAVPVEGGCFSILLDDRPLRTPAKLLLCVPTEALALAIAEEWDSQEGELRPQTMPITRAANTAIDAVARSRSAVVDTIAAFGETDLVCYRAVAPAELRARQAAAWDHLLRWATEDLGARLNCVEGVMFVPQPPASLAALRARVERFSDFGLTGLHDIVALSGSLVIGLAATQGVRTPEVLWEASCLDENWQADQWGKDAEAAQKGTLRKKAFLNAHRFVTLCGDAAYVL